MFSGYAFCKNNLEQFFNTRLTKKDKKRPETTGNDRKRQETTGNDMKRPGTNIANKFDYRPNKGT